MANTTFRRIVLGIVLLVSAFVAFLLGETRWEYMSHNEKPLRQAYAVWQDGSKSYGTYCDETGTKLEGGGVCYINEFSRPYERNEIMRESIGVGMFWLIMIGGSSMLVALLFLTPSGYKVGSVASAARKL